MKRGRLLLRSVFNRLLLELSVSPFAFSGLGGPLGPEFTGSFQLLGQAGSLLAHFSSSTQFSTTLGMHIQNMPRRSMPETTS